MENMMAYCGIICSDCPAYKATISNDMELKEKAAKDWGLKVEDINCKGCNSDTVIGYCGKCEIRACNRSKNQDHCAQCDSYGCEKISGFLKEAPKAKENLENLRK